MIEVTQDALTQMNHILEKNGDAAVRYELSGGGCGGIIGKWDTEAHYEPEIGEITGGYKPAFVKKSQEKIKKDAYVQNEEQTDATNWNKVKKKLTTEEQYHTNIEKRIDGLMAKLDAGELQMEDLTPEDRQVIIDIRMQNESGDSIK